MQNSFLWLFQTVLTFKIYSYTGDDKYKSRRKLKRAMHNEKTIKRISISKYYRKMVLANQTDPLMMKTFSPL